MLQKSEMDKKNYIKNTERMEALLKEFTEKGKLEKQDQLELDRVSDAVQEYEEKYYAFKADTLQEMIELRMYQRKLKQKDLAKILGTTPSRISEILNGKRGLTFELAKALHQKLNIEAELILKS